MQYKCTELSSNIIAITHSKIKQPFFLKFSTNEEHNEFFIKEKNVSDYISARSNFTVKLLGKLCPVIRSANKIGDKVYMSTYIIVNHEKQDIIVSRTFLGDIQGDYIYVLIGKYDVDYIDLHQMFKTITNLNVMVCRCINVCKIIDADFRPNNFVHGDLKMGNILSKITDTKDILIIDLESGLVLGESLIYVDIKNTEMLCLYLENPGYYTKEFLFLFDILVLTLTFLYANRDYDEIYESLCSLSKITEFTSACLDFFTMITLMRHFKHPSKDGCFLIGKKTMSIKKESNTANASYELISSLFLQSEVSLTDIFEDDELIDHCFKMQKIINDRDRYHDLKKNGKIVRVSEDTINNCKRVKTND